MAAVAATLGCRPSLRPLAPQLVIPPISLCGEKVCRDSVEITYLGVSGFLIRHGANAILTAPSFTNPSFWRTFFPFIPVSPDAPFVRSMMMRERLDGISAMLVGHSHYDHLLDVPYVAMLLSPDVKLYGGPTMKNTLWPVAPLRDRLVPLQGAAVGDSGRAGTWFPTASSRIRFMALKSNHPPNILIGPFPYTYARGNVDEPRRSLPRTTRGWKLGETYAYLIDIMGDDGRPVFRIFYQDAAAEPEHAMLPPLAPGDRKDVDVAIICAGNADYATAYPSLLLRELKPRHVIVGHWEDFFRKRTPKHRSITFSNNDRLAAQLDAEKKGAWVTPQPRARIVYLIGGR